MSFKLIDAFKIYNTLKEVVEDKDKKVGITFKFKLLGLIKKFEPFITNMDILRDEKVVEYGKKDEETGRFSISKEDKDYPKFIKDIEDLGKTEIEVDFEKLKVDEVFENGISVDMLVQLYDIMEENK